MIVVPQKNFTRSTLRCQLVLGMAAICCAGCQFAATGHNQEGVRLFNQGQPQAAIKQFQDALASNPRNADAHYNLAATYHRLGSQQSNRDWQTQAENLYKQCLALEPNHADGYRGLAVLYAETSRSDQAFTLMKNWAASSPMVADARVELARLYEEFGDKETAQVHLYQALQVDPNSHRALAALGRLREQAGDYAQALANYQRSLQLNHSQPQISERVASLSRSMPGALPLGNAPSFGPNSTYGANGQRVVNLPTSPIGPRY